MGEWFNQTPIGRAVQTYNKGGLYEALKRVLSDYSATDVGIGPMMLDVPLYHGTPSVFEKFITKLTSKLNLYGPGNYFTDSPEIASGYALGKKTLVPTTIASDVPYADAHLMKLRDKAVELVKKSNETADVVKYIPQETAPNVHKVYLDVNNVFDINKMKLTPQQLESVGLKATDPGNLDQLKKSYPGIEERFSEILDKLGYDAMKHVGGTMTSGVKPHNVYITWKDDKIIPAFSSLTK